MSFNLDKIIEKKIKQLERTDVDKRKDILIDNPNMSNAIKLVYDAIVGNTIPLAAIQGPPGTGKTRIYEEVIEKIFEKQELENDEIIVYIAPTNQLVEEMLERIIRIYFVYSTPGTDEAKEKIKNEVKVFGSKFSASSKFIKMRKHIDDNTKIVLTTNRQYTALKKGVERISKLRVLVDEASKSILHEIFIPLAPVITKKSLKTVGALSVIGDPKQAILIDPVFKADLLLSKLIYVLERKGLKEELFQFLNVTYRLPSPSEKPISSGFYENLLKAYLDASLRLNSIEEVIEERIKYFEKEKYKKHISETIREAVISKKPLILFDTKSKYIYPKFEKVYHYVSLGRARLALEAAITISALTGESVSIVVPYLDMVTIIKHGLSYYSFINKIPKIPFENTREIIERIRVSTIGSMLGGEDNHIVAVLGKEYFVTHGDQQTIYFNEPEQLNVQLSRHKKILVVIGNIHVLASNAKGKKRAIRETAETLANLCGIKEISSSRRKIHEGDGGIYLDATQLDVSM